MKLFICYLGGQLSSGRIGEDHEVVLVVAKNIEDAKKQSLKKWQGGHKNVHLDYITEVTHVDGYEVKLQHHKSQIKNVLNDHDHSTQGL